MLFRSAVHDYRRGGLGRLGFGDGRIVDDAMALLILPLDLRFVGILFLLLVGGLRVFIGVVVRIPIPPLSEERRKELGKVASKSSEDAKVSIRSHRRFGIDEISKLKDENSADEIKRLESKVQELTDKYVNKIDELLLVKQNELLEV